mmetsp:Transcript_158347/g.485158  ORF Transcript_158347/g.485158 Transcript_158347/m.485158 type:complete len:307 (-) Transcript_158347:302-1222(-)
MPSPGPGCWRSGRFKRHGYSLILVVGCLCCDCLECFCHLSTFVHDRASTQSPSTGFAGFDASGTTRFTSRLHPGGGNEAHKPSPRRALGDFSPQAVGLFSNLQRSATFAAGVTVPLGFSGPQLSKEDSRRIARLKHVHYLISTATLCCHLIAIVYATIAVNKLTEVVVRPSSSVMELLVRDYHLAWVGCNVHFIAGLLGMAATLITTAQMMFGPAARPASCMVFSVMLQMMAAANAGIGQGEGLQGGQKFATNFPHLVLVYLRLLLTQTVSSWSILTVASAIAGAVSLLLTVSLLSRSASDRSEPG